MAAVASMPAMEYRSGTYTSGPVTTGQIPATLPYRYGSGAVPSGTLTMPPRSMNSPQMMSIPWQKPKEEIGAKKHDGFDNLSMEQLRVMAVTRSTTVNSLQKEIKELSANERRHEERLQMLEQRFHHITHNSELKLKAPLLYKIRKMIRGSHLLDHEGEMDKIMKEAEEEFGEDAPDLWDYLHAQQLVLGRGYVPLDQQFIAKQQFQENLKRDQHPVVHRMHYAGHQSHPAEEVPCVFVKEAGIYKKEPLHPTPYRNQFWLNLDGPTRHDHQAAAQMHKEAMQDPLARRVDRQDEPGHGEDAKAVDWLGKLKRGEMIDDKPPKDVGFVMPKWMY